MIDIGVDAADRVDEVREALKVRVDDVVDLQVGEDVGLDRLDQQRVAALAVGGVELLGAVAGDGRRAALRRRHVLLRDVDLQVARDRHQVDRRGGGVEPDEQHRVRVRLSK
jgi:hypothetical protein